MERKDTCYAKYGKRFFDLALIIPGFVLIFPLLAVIALVLRSILRSPVLFHQVRPGIHGKPSVIYKFRTMRDVRDANGKLMLLSGGRRRIMLEIMKRPQPVQKLANVLKRSREAIVKEIRFLEQEGLLSRMEDRGTAVLTVTSACVTL